jgi:hypothetical protein
MSNHRQERIRVRPLLAVVAATTLVACGSSQPAPAAPEPAAATNGAAPAPPAATTGATASSPPPVDTTHTTASPTPATTVDAAKPAVLPNGSPACGNVSKRASPSKNCQ